MSKPRSRREAPPEPPEIHWRDGVHLPGTLLWFDAPRRHQLSFVSHAAAGSRSPPAAPAGRERGRGRATGKVLATAATCALSGVRERDALVAEYGRPLSLGPLRIELFPSGYMLGAAQARVTLAAGRVVYTGPLGAGSPTAAPAEVRECDVLVLDGWEVPPAGGPPRAEALAALETAVERALSEGAQPVVVAPDPGPAEDLVLALARFPLRAHGAIAAHVRDYQRLGVALPAVPAFRGRLLPGEVLLWPAPGAAREAAALGRSRTLARLARSRLLWVGTASSPGAGAQVIPLALRADLPALLAYVEAAAPRRVYLWGAGSGSELALALVHRGVDCRPLRPSDQMPLFPRPSSDAASAPGSAAPSGKAG
jgi:putative mRNA 3-end processing factor